MNVCYLLTHLCIYRRFISCNLFLVRWHYPPLCSLSRYPSSLPSLSMSVDVNTLVLKFNGPFRCWLPLRICLVGTFVIFLDLVLRWQYPSSLLLRAPSLPLLPPLVPLRIAMSSSSYFPVITYVHSDGRAVKIICFSGKIYVYFARKRHLLQKLQLMWHNIWLEPHNAEKFLFWKKTNNIFPFLLPLPVCQDIYTNV